MHVSRVFYRINVRRLCLSVNAINCILLKILMDYSSVTSSGIIILQYEIIVNCTSVGSTNREKNVIIVSYVDHRSVSDGIKVWRTIITNATPNHNRASIESVMFSYTTVLKPSFFCLQNRVCPSWKSKQNLDWPVNWSCRIRGTSSWHSVWRQTEDDNCGGVQSIEDVQLAFLHANQMHEVGF